MTPPMTPREKVAALKTNDPTNPAHRLARDLQAGRFASLEQRDDLIEVLSNLPRYAALASGSGDHAELAGKLRSRTDSIVETPLGPFRSSKGRLRNPDGPKAADALEALLAENAALRERLETARIARAAHNRQHGEAERKLAEAERLNDRAADLMRQCTDPERFEGASTLNVYANMRAWLSDLSKEAERG